MIAAIVIGFMVWTVLCFLAGLQVQVRALDRREKALIHQEKAGTGSVVAQATLNGTPYMQGAWK